MNDSSTPDGRTLTFVVAGLLVPGLMASGTILRAQEADELLTIPEERPPVEFSVPPIGPAASLGDVSDFINLTEAKSQFRQGNAPPLDGTGLTVAILDTGLNVGHADFTAAGKIPTQVNLTTDNGGNQADAADGNGHGSHVAGIIAADGGIQGIAPGASVIPVKVLHNNPRAVVPAGFRTDELLAQGLQWVLDNHEQFNISAVNTSISDIRLHERDQFPANATKRRIRRLVRSLNDRRIPVIVSAGNHYCNYNNAARSKPLKQGMGFPAIIRETISVGALYEAVAQGHLHPYADAESHTIVLHQIAPFSTRLHETFGSFSSGNPCRTDIFAPGGLLIESTGHSDPNSYSKYEDGGTSQAAPFVTGVILLLQQFCLQSTNEFPLVSELEQWLRSGGTTILDGDDEYDNVRHTCQEFIGLDAYGAFQKAQAAAVQSALPIQ